MENWQDSFCKDCYFCIRDDANFEGECRENPPPYPLVVKGDWMQNACSHYEQED